MRRTESILCKLTYLINKLKLSFFSFLFKNDYIIPVVLFLTLINHKLLLL